MEGRASNSRKKIFTFLGLILLFVVLLFGFLTFQILAPRSLPKKEAIVGATPPKNTLPAFFPPKATSTADLRDMLEMIYQGFYARQSEGPTMRQLDHLLTRVLESD